MTAISVTSQSRRETRVRRRPLIRPNRVAIFVFLLMAAAFFCVPLYVIVVTSFKTMDRSASARFRAAARLDAHAWHYAWMQAAPESNCSGIGSASSTRSRSSFPSLVLSIALSVVTGYALALWNVRWANSFLFVLFICAFVPFQIIMIPLIKIAGEPRHLRHDLGIAVVHTVLSMPILTLIFRNFSKDIPRELITAAMIDSGSFWRIFFEIVLPMSGNIMIVVLILMITAIWNDFLVGLTFGGLDAQPMTVILNNISVTTTRRGHLQRRHGGGAAHRPPAARHLLRSRQVLRPGHHRRRHQGIDGMPTVEFRNIVKKLRRADRHREPQPRHRRRRIPGAARPVRLRQDHAPQPPRRPARDRRRARS